MEGSNMDKKITDAYVQIIHAELIAAMGCTEPIAIAYCAAKAASVLGCLPEKMLVSCSGNIIKNVKGVIVPNSGGRKGIQTAAVLGAVGGNAQSGLEVLSGITQEDIDTMASLLKNKDYCRVSVKRDGANLHITVTALAGSHKAYVEIKDEHTNIVRILKDEDIIFSLDSQSPEEKPPDLLSQMKELLNLRDILTFADTVDLQSVQEPLLLQIEHNSRISREGIKNDYGMRTGKMLMSRPGVGDIAVLAKAMAAAGSDARMGGCPLPVVINAGSGNQGLTVSIPVIEYAKEMGVGHDLLLRALIVSNLISIHQKRFLGSLSAYCGATSAASGAVCGIAYLSGGGYDTMADIITNTLATIGGMVCDGAKPSCAVKVASALETAFMAYDLQQNGDVFAPGEGLVKEDVEKTIRAIGQMGREGMKSTDAEILDIMLSD